MRLRRSSFAGAVELGGGSVLLLHAVSGARLTVTGEVAAVLEAFAAGAAAAAVADTLGARFGTGAGPVAAAIAELRERGFLHEGTDGEERAEAAALLAPVHGRDPDAALDRHRRARAEGSHPYWNVTEPRGLPDATPVRGRASVLLLGDCDVQMETDFLRAEAARRGVALRVAATFAHDVALAAERPHDVVVVGALRARHAAMSAAPGGGVGDPARPYLLAAGALLDELRAVTNAPILLDNLPEPTVEPLGMADRGLHGHRNRVRRINLALADLAERHADVHVVDMAARFAAAGAAALVDDGLTSFTHLGAPGWMLQRPEGERRAVHNIAADLGSLAELVGGDPYRRERIAAAVHMDAIATVLAIDRRRCVVVDLDGVLWPGTLAETGAPFSWTPAISGPHSHVGLFFGIHEALLALKRRGILLACVSKNDAAVVEKLWRYAPTDPRERLLTPDDFVAVRVNWDDKAANLRSLAAELGLPPGAMVFVDDQPRERERVRAALPDVVVWGDDLPALRRRLLTDPRLQTPRLTAEAGGRTGLVRAQLERARRAEEAADAAGFVAGLAVEATAERVAPGADPALLERAAELMGRVTQFNATGRRFAAVELGAIAARADGRVFVLRMRDRLADHGLVGVAVVEDGTIANVVMSCRVIGLGGERALLDAIRADPGCAPDRLRGRIVATDRNLPVRHLFADAGFGRGADGSYRLVPAPAVG